MAAPHVAGGAAILAQARPHHGRQVLVAAVAPVRQPVVART